MKTTPLTMPELDHISERLPGWSRVAVDGIVRIERIYPVPDYATAMSFGLFILMLGFTMLQLWLGRRGDE